MDLLTDLLRQCGVHRRLLDLSQLAPGRALAFPCERSIGLHVVTRGRVYVHAPGLDAPLELHAGDAAVMARGCHHRLSTQAQVEGLTERPIALHDAQAPAASGQAQDRVAAAVISGAYQLWHTPLHPLFRELPPWFVLRGDSLPRLSPLPLAVGLLEAEAPRRDLGAEIVVHGLLDAIFTWLLREWLARPSPGGAGFALAVRDAPVRTAVQRLHDDIRRAWTLEDLAQACGLSRTALAERFRVAMGDTPLSYLRLLRMQHAMRLLADTEHTLEQVAQAVGYQDAFSFSKVFKRTLGLSPRDFRRQDASDRQAPWRFASG